MKMEKYISKQAKLHTTMEPQDVIKLCFHAAFGAEHLLKDVFAAQRAFCAEFDGISEYVEGEALYESIGDNVCRVNLREWKRRGIPKDWLFYMFLKTTKLSYTQGSPQYLDSKEVFGNAVSIARKLVKAGAFDFDEQAWDAYLKTYSVDDPVAVHHSERYRAAEKPAYRLVSTQFVRLFPIFEAVAPKWDKEMQVVAIDGRCGAGKTLLASTLMDILDGGVVHMDDFFLPTQLRTPERLAQPGGNIHYERVIEEVLPKVHNPEEFTYGRFDCSKMRVTGERTVLSGLLRVVEGSYSCHPKLGDYMTLRVFCDVEPEEQLRRLEQREGAGALKMFEEKWIPMEENYISTFDIRGKADLIL